MSKNSKIFIAIGVCIILIGAFFYSNSNGEILNLHSTSAVVCTKQNGIFHLERKFIIDKHNIVEEYEDNCNYDWSKLSDDDYNELCEEVDNSKVNTNRFLKEYKYCEKDKRMVVSRRTFYYSDSLLDSFYAKMYPNIFEQEFKYVDQNGELDVEAWMNYMQENGFQCNR